TQRRNTAVSMVILASLYDPSPRVTIVGLESLGSKSRLSEEVRLSATKRLLELFRSQGVNVRVNALRAAKHLQALLPENGHVRKVLQLARSDRSWRVRTVARRRRD